MNIRNFDLNLLVVFRDLCKTRSVSQSALNLGLSQPAVSHALKRLKGSLDDELFVRTGSSYSLTEKALELNELVNTYLDQLEDKLFEKPSWEPQTAVKTFTLSGTSYDAFSWFPNMMSAMKLEAPNVKMSMRGIVLEEFLNRMETGAVDLSFAGNLKYFNNFNIETLGERKFSLVCSSQSKKYKRNISLETYLKAEHILYTPTEKPGSQVDDLLSEMGYKRNICIRTSYLNSIPMLIQERDYLSIVPDFFASKVCKHFGLKILKIPFQIPAFKHQMVWHRSKEGSPSQEWLRGYIRENYKKFLA